MNRLLNRKVRVLAEKCKQLVKNNLKFSFGVNQQDVGVQRLTKISTNQFEEKLIFQGKVAMPENKYGFKTIEKSFNNYIRSDLKSSKILDNLLRKNVEFNCKQKMISLQPKTIQVQADSMIITSQQISSHSHFRKWLKNLLLLFFIIKMYDQKGVHCEYDINDMMITIELDERLLDEEQNNEDDEDVKKEKKKKQQKKKSSNKLSPKYNTKDQRYGTMEEIIKHQMQSGQDFQSVEERIIFREIQQNRLHNRQHPKRQQAEAKQHSKVSKQDLASIVFKTSDNEEKKQNQSNLCSPQKQQKLVDGDQSLLILPHGEFDYSKKPALLHVEDEDEEDEDKPPLTESELKIQNDNTLNDYDKTLKFLADFDDEEDEEVSEYEKTLNGLGNLGQKDQQKKQQKTSNQNKDRLKSWFHMDQEKTKLQKIKENKNQKQNITQQVISDVSVSKQSDLKQQIPKKKINQQEQANQTNHQGQEHLNLEKKDSNIQPTKQELIHDLHLDCENTATIQTGPQQLNQASIRIQNFLKLRGIQVNFTRNNNENKLLQNIIKVRLCNRLKQCKNIQIQKESNQNRDVLHHINNFLNPPHIISSMEQAKDLLHLIQKDEYIIGSYIPQKIQNTQQSNTKSPFFDTFSARYPKKNPKQAEHEFNEYKYLSSSKKNCYIIVRDKQIANFLKINTSKVGVPHILYKYDKQLNGKQSEPNCKIDGDFYHSIGNFDKFIEKEHLNTIEKVAQKINALTQRGFTQINIVEDLYDKIRQLRELSVGFSFENKPSGAQQKMKRIFMIKLNDPKSEQQVNQILQKVSKLNKNEVTVIKTKSQALLKSLGIKVHDEYATMRLLDLTEKQQPIIKNKQTKNKNQGGFKRYVPNVPFQVEFLSKWIQNLSQFDKEHVQNDRSVNKLRASYPGDLSKVQAGNMKLVLFYKEGCKGCKIMQQLLSRVQQLKQRLQAGDNQSAKRLKREICQRYRIQNPQHLALLQISKFNILNDQTQTSLPQTTPTLYLFNQKSTQKTILKTDQLFNHLQKMNTNNSQVIHDHMVRDLIQQIQKNVKKLQSLQL